MVVVRSAPRSWVHRWHLLVVVPLLLCGSVEARKARNTRKLQDTGAIADSLASTNDSPFGDSTGVATVQGMDFGSGHMETTAARAASYSSKPNAHFLRRGTRSTLEIMHIERLMGRRALDDWLVAGSGPWLNRRNELDQANDELAELLLISAACIIQPELLVWEEQHGCEIFCGRSYPCATCQDALQNGDEVDVDCGGSCIACASCNDGLLNQNEDDVDCGGVCFECDYVLDTGDGSGGLDWLNGNFTSGGELEPEPEGVDTGANSLLGAASCMAGSGDVICKQQGAMRQIGYDENPFFPWTPGSVAYDNSHWLEYDMLHNGSNPEYEHIVGAHTMYG